MRKVGAVVLVSNGLLAGLLALVTLAANQGVVDSTELSYLSCQLVHEALVYFNENPITPVGTVAEKRSSVLLVFL